MGVYIPDGTRGIIGGDHDDVDVADRDIARGCNEQRGKEGGRRKRMEVGGVKEGEVEWKRVGGVGRGEFGDRWWRVIGLGCCRVS